VASRSLGLPCTPRPIDPIEAGNAAVQHAAAAHALTSRVLCCDGIQMPNGKKVNSRDECHWGHACKSCMRAGGGSNNSLECKILFKNEHRTFAAFEQFVRDCHRCNHLRRLLHPPPSVLMVGLMITRVRKEVVGYTILAFLPMEELEEWRS